jgi:hypothetical protein
MRRFPMSDDMGIPDDVMERADSAWRDRMRESGYTEDANSAITAARHAEYQVIAEWAHEVALEDAARIAHMVHYAAECSTDGMLSAGMQSRSNAGFEIRNAIRALRSGTADTNPKGAPDE